MGKGESKGRIVGSRKDGLGARLLLMLNCIKMGQQFDAKPVIYWPLEDSLATNMEHPEKIFSAQMMDDMFLSKAQFEKASKDAVPLWKFMSDKGPQRMQRHLEKGGDILAEEGFEIVLFAWENDEKVRSMYRGFFDTFELVDILQERCAMVDAALATGASGSTAYHLRRGDILDADPWMHTVWPSKVEPDEYYEAHLDKSPGKAAIIFSDSPQSIERLKDQYPNLKAIGDIAPLEGLSAEQRDFLELYAMSRVDEIIAPILSAYSTAAARISGRQRIRFKEVLNNEDFGVANAKAVDRLLYRPDSYANASDMAHAYTSVATYLAQPPLFDTAHLILNSIKSRGGSNAFIDLYASVNRLYQEKWGDAAGYARAAAEGPGIWPEDYASARAIEAVAYGSSGQRRKAGLTFREAFLFKPLRQDVILAGTNLLLNKMLNQNNFLPFDRVLVRQLALKSTEDNSSSYLLGRLINKRLRRDFRFVALDWHSLVIDGKASRLKNDKKELARMRDRLATLPEETVFDHAMSYQSMKGMIEAHLDDLSAIKLLEAATVGDPENPLFVMRLSDALERQGDSKASLELLRQACRMSGENPLYLHKLGLALMDAGKKGKAAEFLGLAAQSDAPTAKMQGDFAMAAYRTGEYELAHKAMEAALAAIPVFGKFQNQMKRIENAIE